MKITTIVPARNEGRNIRKILEGCLKYSDDVLVVDGHSTDNTRDIAKELGIPVVLDNKKGKGDAIRVGIENAKGDVIVFIDADHSHDPSDIPALVAPLKNNECDHVTGSRMRGGSDELHGDLGKFIRMIGSDIITLSINYRFGVRLTDSQNGFRALKTSVAKQLDLKENITTIEQEMIIKTLALGYHMGEVPAHEYQRKYGESSINVRKVAWRYFYSMVKYLITAPRKPIGSKIN